MFVRSVFLASARRERDTRRCVGFSEQSSLTRPCRLWLSKTFVARRGIENSNGTHYTSSQNRQATDTFHKLPVPPLVKNIPTHSRIYRHIPEATNRSSRINEEGNKKSIGHRTQATHTNTSNPHIPEAPLYTSQSFSNEKPLQ